MMDATRQNRASIAYEWWRKLNPLEAQQSGAQRAALARMRRAATLIEVMQEPEAMRLIARLPRNPERAAALAGVLAFVRETDKRRVARAVGRASFDDDQSALMSEGRFRRLLQVPQNELMEAMRRLVRMTKGTTNVRDLSAAILYWGDRVKKDWIFDYYGVADSIRSEAGASGVPANATGRTGTR